MPSSPASVVYASPRSNVETMPMRRFTVRTSPVHGRGVFAVTRICAGETILEYKGGYRTFRAKPGGSIVKGQVDQQLANRRIRESSRTAKPYCKRLFTGPPPDFTIRTITPNCGATILQLDTIKTAQGKISENGQGVSDGA
jgi:hypothetical protein